MTGHKADITHNDDIIRVVAAIRAMDVLTNNVGLECMTPLDDPAQVADTITINMVCAEQSAEFVSRLRQLSS